MIVFPRTRARKLLRAVENNDESKLDELIDLLGEYFLCDMNQVDIYYKHNKKHIPENECDIIFQDKFIEYRKYILEFCDIILIDDENETIDNEIIQDIKKDINSKDNIINYDEIQQQNDDDFENEFNEVESKIFEFETLISNNKKIDLNILKQLQQKTKAFENLTEMKKWLKSKNFHYDSKTKTFMQV